MSDYTDSRQLKPDPARLWAGGAATAIVAALVAIVGILIARGLADVAILAPKGSGLWGNANTATYAVCSAIVALLATGLMHLLALATPRPTTFFGWIMVLLTLIAVVLPLSLSVKWDTKIATGLLNLIIGLVITLLITSVAQSALKRAAATRQQQPANDWAPTRQWDQGQGPYYP
ncbi:DUF6069 family protein [Amycolatopsis sp.]|uniref:DUF6069 family protein n=1 Tax=Amycolatopsis sp. TaxID=37632 RepID=UPI002BD57220|nr:DUF6069 family protein [Amycolatopsis sp.]HVV09456.1 DUF6069 family protein [Amycolatopsis sp.]